jgi:formylglycine-generating enzyme required for sulfatase activity
LSALGKSPNPRGRFRLPTEAEWEYACRAATTTRFNFGDSEEGLQKYAWRHRGALHPVGEKMPNAWGLYDMHGETWEWCSDWYSEDYYAKSPADDPAGPLEPGFGHARVLRGGDSGCGTRGLWSSFRLWWPASDGAPHVPIGLRVAMTAPDEETPPPAKAEGPKNENARTREVKK